MQSIYDKDVGQEIKQPCAVRDLHVLIISSKPYKKRYMYKYISKPKQRFNRNNVNLKYFIFQCRFG